MVTTDLKQAIHKEMDERLPRFGRQASLPNASTWLEERIKTFQVKHYIHAEAGSMALAVASLSAVRSAVPDDVQDILCSMVSDRSSVYVIRLDVSIGRWGATFCGDHQNVLLDLLASR